MVIMYAAWRFANAEGRSGKFYEAKLGALICGLSLTNQHTSVLYIAPTALWVSLTCEIYNLYVLYNCSATMCIHHAFMWIETKQCIYDENIKILTSLIHELNY